MTAVGRLLASLTLLTVVAGCGDDPDDAGEPAPTVPIDARQLLEAAEVLDDVTVELEATSADTAIVTVRNDRTEGGLAVLEPGLSRQTTIEDPDGTTDLYLRPTTEDDGSELGEEPTRYEGVAVAAADSFELEGTIFVPSGGTLTVCIEASPVRAEGESGRPSDFGARRQSDPIVVICSEPTELGDA